MPDSLGPPGCPYDPGNAGIARPIDVRTVTLHRTIGRWPGDYTVGKTRDHNSGTFQYLIGQAAGQWVQFYPCNTFSSHAAGANNAGPGIELSGQNGEALTDWQVDALGQLLRWLRDEWGVEPTFTDGDPRVWVDERGPRGFVTHRHVAYPPNPSLHHFDYITAEEFQRALGGPAPPPAPPTTQGAPDMWALLALHDDGTSTYLVGAGSAILHDLHGQAKEYGLPTDQIKYVGWDPAGITTKVVTGHTIELLRALWPNVGDHG